MALNIYNKFCPPGEVDAKSYRNWVGILSENEESEELFKLLEARENSGLLQPAARLEFAGLLQKSGRRGESAEIYEQLLDRWEELTRKQRIVLTGNLSKIYLKRNEREKAFEMLEKLHYEKPDDANLNRRLLQMAAELGFWDEWVEIGKKWFENVAGEYIQEKHRRGYTTSDQAKKLKDPHSIADFLLQLYQENYRDELAGCPEEMLGFLLQLSSELPGHESHSRRFLEELLERELPAKQRTNYLDQLARLYHKAKEYDKAVQCCESLRKLKPEDFSVLEKLGRIYLEADNRPKALETFAELFEFQRDNTRAAAGLKELGRRYESEDEYASAAEAYRLIVENSHFEKAEIQYRLGVCLYRLEKYERSLAVFQGIKQGDELFKARILIYMARCLLGMELYEVAVDRISEIDPGNQVFPPRLRREIYYWLARAFEGAGQIDRALEHYRKILASDVEFRDTARRVKELKDGG
ncbi:MAG: tetratricopeptide repeat protein [bacterium]